MINKLPGNKAWIFQIFIPSRSTRNFLLFVSNLCEISANETLYLIERTHVDANNYRLREGTTLCDDYGMHECWTEITYTIDTNVSILAIFSPSSITFRVPKLYYNLFTSKFGVVVQFYSYFQYPFSACTFRCMNFKSYLIPQKLLSHDLSGLVFATCRRLWRVVKSFLSFVIPFYNECVWRVHVNFFFYNSFPTPQRLVLVHLCLIPRFFLTCGSQVYLWKCFLSSHRPVHPRKCSFPFFVHNIFLQNFLIFLFFFTAITKIY